MRKILMLIALLGGVARGVVWEYGFLSEGMGTIVWKPGIGKALFSKKGSYQEMLTLSKCKLTDSPRQDFFNCIGAQGWEFMGSQRFSSSNPDDVTYIFKRTK